MARQPPPASAADTPAPPLTDGFRASAAPGPSPTTPALSPFGSTGRSTTRSPRHAPRPWLELDSHECTESGPTHTDPPGPKKPCTDPETDARRGRGAS